MANMDLAKGFIWTSLALAVAGVGFHFYLQKRLKTADADSANALRSLNLCAVAREDIRVFQREKENDNYLKRDKSARLDEYLADLAKNAAMERGPSKERPQNDTPTNANGWADTSNEISWLGDRSHKIRFTREQIAHFCYSLENNTHLLKITSLQLTTDRDALDDRWDARFTITERAPVNSAAAPN